jgi:hypothetical protein
MMATFVKFQSYAGRQARGEINLHADTLKVYLSNTAPNAATHSVKGDLAEISAGNGYTAGGIDINNAVTESAGTATVTADDAEWTASGGDIGPLRYAVLYDDTHASDALIGYWDRGASVTLLGSAGDAFRVDAPGSVLTIT